MSLWISSGRVDVEPYFFFFGDFCDLQKWIDHAGIRSSGSGGAQKRRTVRCVIPGDACSKDIGIHLQLIVHRYLTNGFHPLTARPGRSDEGVMAFHGYLHNRLAPQSAQPFAGAVRERMCQRGQYRGLIGFAASAGKSSVG